jgi:AbrB family looped-hinge helix DNA binding protein
MAVTTLSSKFQIVIPKEVREFMNLSAGMKFTVVPYGGRIELVPERSMKSLKGSLKGMDVSFEREPDRI